MDITIYTDGIEGWAKQARACAKLLDAGKIPTPSRGITFENASEMARLLTPARLDLFELVKTQPYRMQDLAASLKRNVWTVSRDVSALEKYGILASEQVANPGHGRVRVVLAPARITISAQL